MTRTSLPDHENAIQGLIRQLACGNEVITQQLLDWMAIPLQHPGTKLRQGLLLNGYVQSGSHLLAEILEDVYHHAATRVFTQRLHDPYSAFTPHTQLLSIFHDGTDLDVRTDRKRSTKAIIKDLISAPYVQIKRESCLDATCVNRMNIVFSSGSVDFLGDSCDRRWFVVQAKNHLRLTKSDDLLLSFSQRLERAIGLKNILKAHQVSDALEAV